MKPLERLTHAVTFRAGIIALAAMMVLALSSTSARRVDPAMHAASVAGTVAATPAVAENNDTTQRSTGTDGKAALSAKEVRGASPYIEINNEPAPKLIVDPRFPTCWIRASSGSSGGRRTCTSSRCDRIGEHQPRGLPRTVQDSDVHRT